MTAGRVIQPGGPHLEAHGVTNSANSKTATATAVTTTTTTTTSSSSSRSKITTLHDHRL